MCASGSGGSSADREGKEGRKEGRRVIDAIEEAGSQLNLRV